MKSTQEGSKKTPKKNTEKDINISLYFKHGTKDGHEKEQNATKLNRASILNS